MTKNVPKVAFIGNSHMAYWPLEMYFPKWECLNYGMPGEGIDYIEAFDKDVSDCYAMVQFGTNDLYRLNYDNVEVYAERYVKAVQAIRSRKTLLFCIFPRNDYANSMAVNRFIVRLNEEIKQEVEQTDIVYLDIFDKLLADGHLNPEMTLDGIHLTGAGYRILANALRTFMQGEVL